VLWSVCGVRWICLSAVTIGERCTNHSAPRRAEPENVWTARGASPALHTTLSCILLIYSRLVLSHLTNPPLLRLCGAVPSSFLLFLLDMSRLVCVKESLSPGLLEL
jgi:hypothetical protein